MQYAKSMTSSSTFHLHAMGLGNTQDTYDFESLSTLENVYFVYSNSELGDYAQEVVENILG